jgi:hypothetical protein
MGLTFALQINVLIILCATGVSTGCPIMVVNSIQKQLIMILMVYRLLDSLLHYQKKSFPHWTMFLSLEVKLRLNFELSS